MPSQASALSALLGRNQLKRILVASDIFAIVSAYLVGLWVSGYLADHGWVKTLAIGAAAGVGGFWALRSQGLFLARVSSIRVLEITRATRAIALLAALLLLLDRFASLELRVSQDLIAAGLTFVFFIVSRSVYRSWLQHARSAGRFCRRVVMIGADSEASRIVTLIETHPELGTKVAGVVGGRDGAKLNGLAALWLGDTSQAEELIAQTAVTGVVVSPASMPPHRLSEFMRNMQKLHVHVFVATGFSGIDARRVRALSLAHEPMLYVEAPSLAKMQALAKRGFDIVMASVAVILASPAMLTVALAIKLTDRGPILFRQERVGKDGKRFAVLKFRTMIVDAERHLAVLQAGNERRGPLFKMVNDPRVTRIGRILRETSLDEMPQLFNVIKGEMSLVGPRPALPKEAEQFSDELRGRERVMPGITGLWQVDARDNPSFEAYRRLDLFYVENWSLTLDLFIILGTIEQILARLVSTVFKRRRTATADVSGHAAHETFVPVGSWAALSSVEEPRLDTSIAAS